MHPITAELVNRHRRTIAGLEEQVRLMEAWLSGSREGGAFGTHDGSGDTTARSIARTRQQITELQALVDKHDPEGFTKIV